MNNNFDMNHLYFAKVQLNNSYLIFRGDVFIKTILRLFTLFSISALMSVCCFADAVFRSEGITDLSAIQLLCSSDRVTLLKVPDPHHGQLICRGAELSDFDTIEREELDSLVFVPFSEQYLCSIELQPQGESSPLAITVTNQDCKVSSYSLEAGEYCWAWAKSGYFSHIRDAVPATAAGL